MINIVMESLAVMPFRHIFWSSQNNNKKAAGLWFRHFHNIVFWLKGNITFLCVCDTFYLLPVK